MQRTTGLIHIYHGDGKGKTTSAMGLALRSLGHNHKVVVAQFLKDGTSGECRMLAKHDNLTLLAANPYSKFTFQMTDEEKEQTKQSINRMFKAATQFCINNNADLLILDEICDAITTCMFDDNILLCFIPFIIVFLIARGALYGYKDNKVINKKNTPLFRDIPCNKDIYYANALAGLNN